MTPRLKRLLSGLLLLTALTGGFLLGRAIPADPPWGLDTLRGLDPLDATSPESEITALYTRPWGIGCQLRLDLLNLPEDPTASLQITWPGKTATYPPTSPAIAYDFPASSIILTLDTCEPLLVTLLSPAGLPLDSAAPGGPRPRASYLLIFNQPFSPAATPIQALRAWHGAHTGPRGERHGLRYLLEFSQKMRIPIHFIDMGNLPALQALNTLPQMRQMASQKLLFAWESQSFARFSGGEISQQIHTLAFFSRDSHSPAPGLWPLGLPLPEAGQLGPNGISLPLRVALHQAALSAQAAPIYLGGDFAQSDWGTPEYLAPAFAYLAARPYLHPFTPLASPPARVGEPVEPLAQTARAAEAVLNSNETPPELRPAYVALPALLAFAVRWQAHPSAGETCVQEWLACFVYSENVLSIFSYDGRMLFLFVRDDLGAHQLVGPTAQFSIGLSDASQWNLSAGWGADAVAGQGLLPAVGDPLLAPVLFKNEQTGERGAIFAKETGPAMQFTLLANGISIKARHLPPGAQFVVPMAVDPWQTRVEGWPGRFLTDAAPGRARLGWRSGPMAWVTASGRVVPLVESPLAAIPSLFPPEDPNQPPAPGSFIPFGMVLVSFPAFAGPDGVAWLEIGLEGR